MSQYSEWVESYREAVAQAREGRRTNGRDLQAAAARLVASLRELAGEPNDDGALLGLTPSDNPGGDVVSPASLNDFQGGDTLRFGIGLSAVHNRTLLARHGIVVSLTVLPNPHVFRMRVGEGVHQADLQGDCRAPGSAARVLWEKLTAEFAG